MFKRFWNWLMTPVIDTTPKAPSRELSEMVVRRAEVLANRRGTASLQDGR